MGQMKADLRRLVSHDHIPNNALWMVLTVVLNVLVVSKNKKTTAYFAQYNKSSLLSCKEPIRIKYLF